MSLDIGAVLREGGARVTERNALLLMAAFVLVGLLSAVVMDSFYAAFGDAARGLINQTANGSQGTNGTSGVNGTGLPPALLNGTTSATSPFAVDIPLSVATLLAVSSGIVAEAVNIIAVRTFVSDTTRTIPTEFIRRRIAWVTANGFVGGVAVLALLILPFFAVSIVGAALQVTAGPGIGLAVVGIGLLAGIVLSIFLAISFLFVRQEIATNDVNFVDGMTSSWVLTRGNRFELLGLGVVLLVVIALGNLPGFILSTTDPTGARVLSTVISGTISVFVAAVVSRAYVHLKTDEETRSDTDSEEDPYAGALGPDDLDPPE